MKNTSKKIMDLVDNYAESTQTLKHTDWLKVRQHVIEALIDIESLVCWDVPKFVELMNERDTLKQCLFQAQEAAKSTIKEPLKVHVSAEEYLRNEYGAFRGHFAWREIQQAYVQGRYDEQMAQGLIPWPHGKPACSHEWVNCEQDQPWLICEKCGATYAATAK